MIVKLQTHSFGCSSVVVVVVVVVVVAVAAATVAAALFRYKICAFVLLRDCSSDLVGEQAVQTGM